MTPKLSQIVAARPRTHLLLAAASMLLIPAALLAQAAPAPNVVDAQALAKYDKNHDGRLDPDELAAMNADEAKSGAAVTATGGANAPAKEDVVQMSPFEVSGAGDKGYYAANTMSGTRLNTKLEDLGSSISVVTKQQMQDLALQDINDIFLYEANTEGTGNYTDFTVDRNGNVIDNVAGNPNNANRVRGIGPANQARGNFATSTSVPMDPINVDAVEISRGPNSSIFGLGNASGTVNIIPARANLTRESSMVELRVDDRGSTRSALDLNRPLVRGKLAVRGSVVYQEDDFKLKPSVSRTKRYNGMITWKPLKNTTIRGATEYYENYARRPNAVLPRDAVTYWEQVGRPTWDASTWTVTRNGTNTVVPYNNNQGTETGLLGPGLESGGSALYARPSFFIEPDGTIPLWMIGQMSAVNTLGIATPDFHTTSGNQRLVESAPAPKPGPLAQSMLSLNNKAYYDWQKVNLAAPNWGQSRTRTFNVEAEHFFIQTQRQLLAIQLGWFREETESYNRTFIGQSSNSPMIVYVDVNTKLLDGRVNPFFGRPYIESYEPSAYRNRYFRDQFRGQAVYQLTLSKDRRWWHWLGDHQFSGYGEYKNQITRALQYRDAITDNHDWLLAGTNRGNGTTAARGYYRYYLGDNQGDNVDSAPPAWRTSAGTYNLNWYNGLTKQWVSEPATIGEVFANVGNNSQRRNIIKTEGGAMQNHLLDDRVVTTFGLRKDSNQNRDSAFTGVAPDGQTADLGTSRTWPNNWFRRDGRTKTAGVVVKPFRNFQWLDHRAAAGGVTGFLADVVRSIDLHYNRSDSFTPDVIAQNLVGELLPDPTGKGKDYGFSLNLYGDKLVVRYNQYDVTQINSRAGDSGVIASRAARLDFSALTGGTDRFNLYRNARDWVSQTNPGITDAQLATEVAREMGFPEDQLARMNAYTISDTSDVTSKGKEIEVNFNPTSNWTTKITVGQMKTIDNHLSRGIGEYIANRMPIWTTIPDLRTRAAGPDGVLNTPDDTFSLWWTTKYSGTSPQDFFLGSVQAPYKLATANEGKPKSQIRQWRVNAISTLRLAALTNNSFIKRFAVNGAVRWEDKASIGYYGDPNDINSFDPSRPIYDKAHMYLDAGMFYTQKIYHNRINMRLQFNVRNLTEGGRLQPIGAWPDGRIWNYRIIDPRQFILTASFDL